MPTRIAILVFDHVDVLDVGGPYEVFLTAGRLAERGGASNPFEVITVGVEHRPYGSYGGLGLVPDHTVSGAGPLDVVVIPGAIAIDTVAGNRQTMEAVGALIDAADVAASVCTGAFLLGDAGALDGLPWTTHWEDVDALALRMESSDGVVAQWVDTGEVVTAGGLSNGIAMALHLVERFADEELAEATARQIGYPWDPDDGVDVR